MDNVFRSHISTVQIKMHGQYHFFRQIAQFDDKKFLFHPIKYKNTFLNDMTYKVPARPVLRWLWSSMKFLAKPKSAILGLNLSSNSMLLAFMSLCMILISEALWRYDRPSAVPRMISDRRSQSNAVFLNASATSTMKDQNLSTLSSMASSKIQNAGILLQCSSLVPNK